MSVYCNITVQFEVREEKGLKALSQEYAERMRSLKDTDGFDRDAYRMLHYMSEGKGVAYGPKGDMFTWGSVGNYSNVDLFVDALKGFWARLYWDRVVMDSDGVVVMFQQEQRPFTKTVEIRSKRPRNQGLIITEYESPFPLFGWFYERDERMLPQGSITREEVRDD